MVEKRKWNVSVETHVAEGDQRRDGVVIAFAQRINPIIFVRLGLNRRAARGRDPSWNGIWKSTHLPCNVKEWVSMSKWDYVGTLRKRRRRSTLDLWASSGVLDTRAFGAIVIARRRTRGYLLSSSDSIDRQAEITVAVRWPASRFPSFILIAAYFVIGTSFFLKARNVRLPSVLFLETSLLGFSTLLAVNNREGILKWQFLLCNDERGKCEFVAWVKSLAESEAYLLVLGYFRIFRD